MDLINKILENNTFFYSIIGILVFSLGLILYFLITGNKGKKDVITQYEDNKEKEELEEKQKIMTEDQISAKLELQKVLEQMNEDITTKPKEAIETFENEQEENAIISYQELVNNVRNEKAIKIDLKDIYEEEFIDEDIKTGTNKNEEQMNEEEQVNIEEKSDSNIEVIEIMDELKELMNQKENKELQKKETIIETSKKDKPVYKTFKFDESIINEKADKKDDLESIDYMNTIRSFQTTDFVSPIYGKQEIKSEYPKVTSFNKKDKSEVFKESLIEIENTLEMEPLTDEDKFNEEFLSALKSFRKNL